MDCDSETKRQEASEALQDMWQPLRIRNVDPSLSGLGLLLLVEAMDMQWAETTSQLCFAVIHASWTSSGDRWLGLTLAFSKTYLAQGEPKPIENTVLT